MREAEGDEAAGDHVSQAAGGDQVQKRRRRKRILLLSLILVVILVPANLPPGRILLGFLGGGSFMATCSYVSGDGKFDELEAPFKGRDLAVVERAFEEYRQQTGQPDLILYRTTPRVWWRFWMWSEYATHPRWAYPYREPASKDGNSQ